MPSRRRIDVHLEPSKRQDPVARAAIDRRSAELLFPQFAATRNEEKRCSA